jgi:hypothetical protein
MIMIRISNCNMPHYFLNLLSTRTFTTKKAQKKGCFKLKLSRHCDAESACLSDVGRSRRLLTYWAAVQNQRLKASVDNRRNTESVVCRATGNAIPHHTWPVTIVAHNARKRRQPRVTPNIAFRVNATRKSIPIGRLDPGDRNASFKASIALEVVKNHRLRVAHARPDEGLCNREALSL